jgi:hypothetical protein
MTKAGQTILQQRKHMQWIASGSSVELDLAPGGATCRIVVPLARLAPATAEATG